MEVERDPPEDEGPPWRKDRGREAGQADRGMQGKEVRGSVGDVTAQAAGQKT